MSKHPLSDDVRNWNKRAADSMDEMIEALEFVEKGAMQHAYQHVRDEAWEKVRSAIAKAKGESIESDN